MNNQETKVGYTKIYFEWELNSISVYKIEFQVLDKKTSFDPNHAAQFLSESFERYLKQKKQ